MLHKTFLLTGELETETAVRAFAVSRESSKCFLSQEVRSSAKLRDAATCLSIADFPDTFNPDSRTRAMLFLIPDCAARPMPDSRSPAMSFSFPDYAKWAMTDSRPSVIFFSIPDYARDANSEIRIPAQTKENPVTRTGLGEYEMQRTAANYWTLAVLFTAPRSSRCSSPKARLPDFSSGCFSKTT